MANLALLRIGQGQNGGDLVAYIISSDAQRAQLPEADRNLPSRDGTNAQVGDTWNGLAYVPRALPARVVNENTIREQAYAAMVANRQTRVQIAQWLATNTGAQLNSATLTSGMKQIMQVLDRMCQTENGILRLLFGDLDATD